MVGRRLLVTIAGVIDLADRVLDFAEHHHLVGEFREPRPAQNEHGSETEFHAELALEAGHRTVVREVARQQSIGSHAYAFNLVRRDVVGEHDFLQLADPRMRQPARRKRLDRDARVGDKGPRLAQRMHDRIGVALADISLEEAARAFEHRGGRGESHRREIGREYARFAGAPGVQWFRHGTEILAHAG